MWPFKRTKKSKSNSRLKAGGASIEQKRSKLGGLFYSTFGSFGSSGMHQRGEYIRDGYMSNEVIAWCVSQIANAIASVPVELRDENDDRLDSKHPANTLLHSPSPMNDWYSLIGDIVRWQLITGDAFVERSVVNRRLTEIYTYQPDNARYVADKSGRLVELRLGIAGREKVFRINPVTMDSDILHLRLFNPDNPLFGLSPVQIAGRHVNQMNVTADWNYNIVNQGIALCGILKVHSMLGPGDSDAYREAFLKNYTGSRNLEVAVFGENVDYTPLTNGIDSLLANENTGDIIRLICLAFNIPPYLIGLKDGATFSNMAEAREMFYDTTIIPMTNSLYGKIGIWLSNAFGEKINIKPLWTKVQVLAQRQRDTWKNIDEVTFLSINEKRKMAGLPSFEGGDIVVQKPNMVPVGEVSDEVG